MEDLLIPIIGGGVVLIAGVLFFVMKKKQSDNLDELATEANTKKEVPQGTVKQKEKAPEVEKVEEPVKESLKEEVVQTPAPEIKIASITAKNVTKRDVPEHGKIVKQDLAIFAGTKILVAEDNMINQKVIKGLLGDSGIELTMADDGQITVDILEKNSDFHIVLMDAHMPNIDGFEATRIIRANPNYEHILVVALSGDTAVDDIRKMREAGMEEQLAKPLKMDALYDILYAYGVLNEVDDVEESAVEASESTSTQYVELNIEQGLETFGGDEDFYKEEGLVPFLEGYENIADVVDELVINEEFDKLNGLLHDVLGVAGSIGALKLQANTTTMKESVKETNGESYGDYSEAYREQVSRLIKEIKEYL
ncbi:MAG: response regulator [Campylobacterota bacterium]|nr:response regulator [Campylobacterota bacterium]